MVRVLFLVLLFPILALSQAITPDLEYQKISLVSYSWKQVSFSNSYSDAIVVCSNVLPSSTQKEVVVRIQNISSTGFDVKIQQPNNSDAGYSTDVYCIISDEGSYTTPLKYEAHKVLSTGTAGQKVSNTWSSVNTEDVSASVTQTYIRPAVLGQVMSYNDTDFSTFWSFDCDNKQNRAFQSGMADGICVGKQVGQINEQRSDETLGYIVAEAGIYDFNNFSMAVDYGSDSVAGVGNSPAYSYTLDKAYTHGVVTQEAMDGGNGGWAVLYGASPFGTSLDLAIDEETVAFDSSRKHTKEEVAYWVFLRDPTFPDIKLEKTSETIYDPVNLQNNPKAIPSAVVKYLIEFRNEGLGETDNNTIALEDSIPSNMKICVTTLSNCLVTTLIDGTISSGLTLGSMEYSNDNASTFTYTPIPDAEGYDSSVTDVKFLLNGAFSASDGTNHPSATIEFYMGVE